MSKLNHILQRRIQPLLLSRGMERNTARQERVLGKIIQDVVDTDFGRVYGFHKMLTESEVSNLYRSTVPIHSYEQMSVWWQRCVEGEENVVVPGVVPYFALSSGTSEGASKYIPVTKKHLAQIRAEGLKFMWWIARNRDIPATTFSKHHLMIGGSTKLKYDGIKYSGDLSGIAQLNIPFWYKGISKPDNKLMQLDWEQKIQNIVNHAPDWDVSIITGIPSWVQIVLERIVNHYGLTSIHDIWPDLTVYIHSGIKADPYWQSINKLFGKRVFWYDSYLASEGFFAYKRRSDAAGMKLVLGNKVFFEFVPFDEVHFDEDGNIRPNVSSLVLHEVQEEVDYALIITTASGAYRYLIGDTVRFTSVADAEIVVTGRTKHYLSVAGEHLSVDNMSTAILHITEVGGFECREFTVYALPDGAQYRHVWDIGCDVTVDVLKMKEELDKKLRELNEDYDTERMMAIKDIAVNMIPNEVFYEFLKLQGRVGGQVKFPRVLRGKPLKDWLAFKATHHFMA